jgi:hypothetical protein
MRRVHAIVVAGTLISMLWSRAAQAHFLWLESGKPGTDTPAVRLYFSERAEPDDPALLDRLGEVKAFFRSTDGKFRVLPLRRSEGALVGDGIGNEPVVIGLSHTYGVMTRGDETFLLKYHAKTYSGGDSASWQRFGATKELPLEIVPRVDDRRLELTVLWKGKPLAGAEVIVAGPGITTVKEPSDQSGRVACTLADAGLYSVRARHIEASAGTHAGKEYASVRHYSTLTVSIDETPTNSPTAAKKAAFPPLPVAVSSLGAAASDGYVYVYGGHSGRAHDYSTDTVIGSFMRLDLANPSQGWEPLPAGPRLQGLALVAHGGKLIRVGGMQPRNQPDEESDTVSVATCAAFDPKTKTWESLPDLPKGRSSHDAAVIGDNLIVVGGWCLNGRGGEREWHDTALVLDLSKKHLAWESIPQPFQRRALNVAGLDGKVFVVCGMTPDNELELSVDVLDVATKRWSAAPRIPGQVRNGFTPAACSAGGRIYVNPADGKLYRLAATGDAWEDAGSVENPRVVHRMVPVRDDLLLVLGGSSRAGNVAATEAIEPLANPAATSSRGPEPSDTGK